MACEIDGQEVNQMFYIAVHDVKAEEKENDEKID